MISLLISMLTVSEPEQRDAILSISFLKFIITMKPVQRHWVSIHQKRACLVISLFKLKFKLCITNATKDKWCPTRFRVVTSESSILY